VVNDNAALSVAQALQEAHLRGVERLDAQLMLCALVKQGRTWLVAHSEAPLPAQQAAQWAQWLNRRVAGEPLAYLLGEKEFHGLTLQISADVLVPRADTETLVDWALEVLACLSSPARPRVVDLGCGSGAVALAVKHAHPRAHVTAVDASLEALRITEANAAELALQVQLCHSNWWSALAGQRFDLALSNPPYVAQGDPHLAALQHEPRMALISGASGLDALTHLIAHAPAHLQPGAWLLLEHGHTQAAAVRALLVERGFQDPQTRLDLGGHERCTGGRWRGDCAAHASRDQSLKTG
jgi:release factor glutamine methyltransferase